MRKGQDSAAMLVVLGYGIRRRTPAVVVLPPGTRCWGQRQTYCVDIKAASEARLRIVEMLGRLQFG
jgi:hypothetical protein